MSIRKQKYSTLGHTKLLRFSFLPSFLTLGGGEVPARTPKLVTFINVTSAHAPSVFPYTSSRLVTPPGSEAVFSLDHSSSLSRQGEEGQIGPAGLNSSEGPKVSARVCCFPTGCHFLAWKTGMWPPCRGPSTQGHLPGEGLQPRGPLPVHGTPLTCPCPMAESPQGCRAAGLGDTCRFAPSVFPFVWILGMPRT